MSRGPLRKMACLIVSWLTWSAIVAGQVARPAVSIAPEQMRRVPASDPASWPAGEWRPAPRAWLDDYLQTLTLPSAARLDSVQSLWSAHYRGKFEDGSLRGICEFTLREDEEDRRPVLLSPLSVRWHDVEWKGGPAIYGTRLDGKTILLPDGVQTAGHARWELSGQKVFDRWEFAVQIPSAGLSELTLDLPAELSLQSSAGIIEGPVAAETDGFLRWTIHVGRRVAFKLSCVSNESAEAGQRALLRENHVATLQGEGADIVSDYDLAAGDPPQQLVLEIPPQLRVLSVTGGAETRLAFHVRTEGTTRRLSVPWPNSPREPRLRIRSFGVVDWSAEETATVPVPKLVQERPVERQLTVHVRPPLQLQTCEHPGYRLTDRRLDAESTETWSFLALAPDAELKLLLSAPAAALSAQSVTVADYRQEIAQLHSQLRVAGGGGPTFTVMVECPKDWEVTAVSTSMGSSVAVTGFHVAPSTHPQWQQLSIDLAEPLTAGDTLNCRVDAVAAVRPWGVAFALPGLRMSDSSGADGVIAVMSPANAELVGDLPPLAATPDQILLDQLATLSDDRDWSNALFFDQSAVSRLNSPASVTFEPLAAIRDPLTGTDVAPASTATGSPSDGQLAFGDLRLTTQLASRGARTHRHVAVYQLERPCRETVQFQLNSACSHVQLDVDGVNTRIISDQPGGWRTPQAVPMRRQLIVRYESPTTDGRFLSRETIPLPQWTADVLLTWRLIPAPTRACTGIDVPFSHIIEHEQLPWTARCFGPLARRHEPDPDRQTGIPFDSTPDAADEVSAASFAPVHLQRGITELQAAAAPLELKLTTWNPQLAEQAAWAILMSTMTLSVILRRLRWNWWRRLAPVVLLGLIGATFLAPDSCARLSGGCLIGFVLALVLPRRWILPAGVLSRSPASPSSPSGSGLRPVAATAGVLAFLCGLLLSRSSVSQSPPQTGQSLPAIVGPAASIEVLLPEQDGEQSATVYVSPRVLTALETWQAGRDAASSWVLRDASYSISIDDAADDADVVARYEVLVRQSKQRQAIRLALGSVTFRSADAVTVDGTPVTIIPASQGEAIIVLIDPPAERDGDGDSQVWTRHAVEVHCQAAVHSFTDRRQLSFEIPIVAATSVEWRGTPSALATLSMPGVPTPSAPNKVLEFDIGGRNKIEAEWSRSIPDKPTAAFSNAVTQLEVGPLRRLGTTLIELPVTADARQQTWTLPLHSGVTVRRVRCGTELTYRLRSDRIGLIVDLLAASPLEEAPVVTIESIIPTTDLPTGSGSAPLTGILRTSDSQTEWVSVRSQAGFNAAVLLAGTPARPVSLPPDLAMRVASRPDGMANEYYRIRDEDAWQVKVAPQPTQRRAAADTRLRLDRNQVHWSIQMTMDVSGAPTPMHQLRLSPSVRVDRISAVQDGVDRLARFIRDKDRLDLILSRSYSGSIDIQIEGHLTVPDESLQPIPQCDVVNGTFTSSISDITNASHWTAEVVRAQRGPTQLPPNGEGLVYTDADTDPPISFRLISGPDAVAAEQTVQFLRNGEDDWQQRISLDLRPQGVTLGVVTLRLPPSWGGGAKLIPAGDITAQETDAEGWHLIRLHPSRLRGGSYRVQLQSTLDVNTADAIWQYVPLQISSARLRRSRLALPSDFPFRPTSATASARLMEAPSGSRLRASERGLLVDVATDASIWSFKADRPDGPVLSVPLMDTVVWVDSSAGLRGTTWLTVIARQSTELSLQLPDGVEVRRISQDAADVEFDQQSRRLTMMRLPANLTEGPLAVEWSLPVSHRSVDVVPLLTPVGWTAGERLLTLIPAEGAVGRMPSTSSPLEIACRRMSALVIAAELQSTRTFTLDSPLLVAIRQLDGRLERGLQTPGVPTDLRARCSAVKSRWQRVHQLIAVETAPPGDDLLRPLAAAANDWLHPHLQEASHSSVLTADQTELRLRQRTPQWRGYLAAGVLVLAGAVVVWLQKWLRLENSADWFATRPDLVCVLLGSFWTWQLQPRLVGGLLIVTGFLLWLLRGRRVPPPTDTALVGPGAD
ncbi:MAG: hypothetical protein ACK5Q5_20590 [Planctomycetaceae bacterium]